MESAMKPFSPDAERCYRDLPKVSAGYQRGFEDLLALTRGTEPFAERFAKVIAKHDAIIEAGRVAPKGPLMEEDVYLCCFYDALNGWLAREARQVVDAKGSPEATQQALAGLLAPIDALPWSSPKWNTIEKPRLKARVTEAQPH